MKRLGILTGGGDVPGLNVVIKTVCKRAFAESMEVVGLRKGWGGIVSVQPDDPESVATFTLPLDADSVRPIDRFGGTMLHSSRTNPGEMRESDIPDHLDASKWTANENGRRDLTDVVIANLEALGIDSLVVTGGDDTLGYAARLHAAGFPVIGVPKTMDNDVWGTDYCLGFSTAITRSVDLIHQLRTPAGSHERISIIELFGRNSGATALYTGMLVGAHRTLVPEVPFDPERVATFLAEDQDCNPAHYAICVVSEGAHPAGGDIFESGEEDAYGHKKLGGIGAWLAREVRERTGRETLEQKLAYLMRAGAPDSLDRMVGMAFGTMAFEALQAGRSGLLTAVVEGQYRSVSLSEVRAGARPAKVEENYDSEQYRPRLRGLEGRTMVFG
ncbi:phosphofructokinase [bacterium]|nr:MAG: phosphofructokinase [bacterium]RKZ17465.1 MAG: phosphofructokinase [bacterium]